MNASPPIPTRKAPVTVRLSKEVHFALRIAAAKQGVTIEHCLDQIVRDGLKRLGVQ